LLRRADDPPDADPAHVLVLATLAAPERRHVRRRAHKRKAEVEPDPAAVTTSRATIVDVSAPFARADDAAGWLAHAGEDELATDLEVLNRALYAFRLVTADPYVNTIGRRQALVARIGYGAGEEVAEGRWSEARELIPAAPRHRRARILQPQARLAAVLGARERALACEELALRARVDLDHGRHRQAALQLCVALDAALAELPRDPAAPALGERIEELRGRREAIANAAQAALAGRLSDGDREAVSFTLGRIEAALRARAVASA
jgi:hypothetical protein